MRRENAELRLYFGALLRILIEKRIVAPKEVPAAVAALTTEGAAPRDPAREADWTGAPPAVRDTK
jgi:hypothetical protein